MPEEVHVPFNLAGKWHSFLISSLSNSVYMQNWLRALIAGYGAKKLGGGCFGTIIVFVIIYWLLGHC